MKTYEVKIVHDDKGRPPWVFVLCNGEVIRAMSVEEWNERVPNEYRINHSEHTLPKTPRKKGCSEG